jgi:hypothetical protein
MIDAPLPQGVSRLSQKKFAAIPGSPWVYWIDERIRNLFKELPKLEDVAHPCQGMTTADNERFLRCWWEIGKNIIVLGCPTREHSIFTGKRWFPYMKGGGFVKWYGLRQLIINWKNDGEEIRATGRATLRNQNYYFRDGVTWSSLSAKGFAVRWMESGFLFDDKGSCGFPISCSKHSLIAVLNSSFTSFALNLLNPSISFQSGDLARVPFINVRNKQPQALERFVNQAVWYSKQKCYQDETSLDFSSSPISIQIISEAKAFLERIESQIDDEVFSLYDISPADRTAIKAELTGNLASESEESDSAVTEDQEEVSHTMNTEELAARLISYAIGIVLGRFQPGEPGALGSAVYRLSDFAIGSLPVPDEAEFDELVGTTGTFAYTDPQGGRHVFSTQVEQALRTLAISDGIAVLDEGNPRDLAKLVASALELMLGETQAREITQTGAGGDLRKFLEKDFFTAWHFKWYRKRPVYWPIQSSRRSYGFVIFHEKITRETFYAIQREPYLDTKRNAVALRIADAQNALGRATGVARKKLEKELDELQKLADELTAFAKDLEAITRTGYEPEENWIDDGVILRMAPLWKIIPIWKSEPKKYWERLENGDFDWSHLAMKYWPDRVRQKCKQNKSYAIAHGHEEWYQG